MKWQDGHLNGILASWLQLGPILAVEAIWIVKEQMENSISLSLSAFQTYESLKIKLFIYFERHIYIKHLPGELTRSCIRRAATQPGILIYDWCSKQQLNPLYHDACPFHKLLEDSSCPWISNCSTTNNPPLVPFSTNFLKQTPVGFSFRGCHASLRTTLFMGLSGRAEQSRELLPSSWGYPGNPQFVLCTALHQQHVQYQQTALS